MSTPSGEFYVPLATTEGTLVASYNRGMRLLYEAGGVRTTVMDDRMQRAPVFVFPSAREARDFGQWLDEHFARDQGGRRDDDTLGRAAGHRALRRRPSALHPLQLHDRRRRRPEHDRQGDPARRASGSSNATPEVEHFLLEGSFATDKKSSQVNMLRTRGKRVIAEALVPDELLRRVMRTSSATMFKARQLSNLGGFMAGVNNNGAHSANAITALFIATGQDAANVAESSAAYVYAERRDNGDYYYSVTIPALIVATYGGGTGLPTQRECLEMLDCYGPARSTSSPRSSPPPSSAASCRSVQRSSATSGWRPTTSSGVTARKLDATELPGRSTAITRNAPSGILTAGRRANRPRCLWP